MTGVAVSNQLLFVFNLCIFGAVSGAGIFGAQFFGKKDHVGLQHTFRFKVIFCVGLTIVGMALMYFGGESLISLYLRGEGAEIDPLLTMSQAKEYLNIMLIGLIPYTLVQCYASTLKESGQTVLPMAGGVSAVLVNLILNYILIFGRFGAPRLGVAGAAIATVISRFVELGIVLLWTHLKSKEYPFIKGAYRSLHVPVALVKQIAAKGLPLMLNETLWAAGVAIVNQCYSLRGLDVVAANNISQTFWNVFSVAFLSVGGAISIILGQMLGAGEMKEAKTAATRLITFSILISSAMAILYVFAAIYIPAAYNTTQAVRILATRIMQLSAIAMPLDACANSCYFTLRSGGKTGITFIFDSGFVWVIQIPVAAALAYFTSMPILPLFLICQLVCVIKCFVGLLFVHRGSWIKNIVS